MPNSKRDVQAKVIQCMCVGGWRVSITRDNLSVPQKVHSNSVLNPQHNPQGTGSPSPCWYPPASLHSPIPLANCMPATQASRLFSEQTNFFSGSGPGSVPTLPLLLSGLNLSLLQGVHSIPQTSRLPVTLIFVCTTPTLALVYVVPEPQIFFFFFFWLNNE